LYPLDLAVRSGECLVVLGHPGAGKTTLLHLLAGLTRPTAGRALLLGRAADVPSTRACLGFVPESPSLPPTLRGLDLLLLRGRLHGLTAREAARRSLELLTRLGMEDQGERPIAHMSAGARQRVSLAQALLRRPEVLLLDDPFAGLDRASREAFMALVRDVRAAGTTILVATHELAGWSSDCDRIAVLCRGRMRSLGAVADVLATLPARITFRWPTAGAVVQSRSVTPDERGAALRELLSVGADILGIEPAEERLLAPSHTEAAP
jgi:ABC-type multidrug transport system ATPase subunit